MTDAIRILLISPNPEYSGNIQVMLRHEGYAAEVCPDSAAAKGRLQKSLYHFVLLGVLLPEEEQLELMDYVKDYCPDTLVIQISWYAILQSAVEALHTKPRDRATGLVNMEAIKMTLDRMTHSIHRRKRDREARERAQTMAKDLQESNLRLMELDRKKTDCLAFATHELRTPITIINGYLKLLTGESFGRLNSEQKHFVEECGRNCSRLLNLVNSMLDRCRIESDMMEIDMQRRSYFGTVEAVVAQMRNYMEENGLEVKLELPEAPVFIQYDANAIEQALMNMIGNAVKFTNAPGQVLVRCREVPEGLLTEVIDSGIGIDPEDLEQVFDEFNKVGKQHGEKKGAGLGLSICKKIIQAHNGVIYAASKPGKGSCFSFTLPLESEKSCPL
ncbi:MAG: ATP-binding protein [bacterium]|nr:ATP-binding protein [bacterium]